MAELGQNPSEKIVTTEAVKPIVRINLAKPRPMFPPLGPVTQSTWIPPMIPGIPGPWGPWMPTSLPIPPITGGSAPTETDYTALAAAYAASNAGINLQAGNNTNENRGKLSTS
ncbi:unnamed protein product [Soboliphyme baturini]|uniref:Pre-mRNA-processing-splicing factor 8 n=1 Tax=Soboliphyme baturini TaxID=241478 RepID=A0A183IAB8_9BILA|nr:unnamed protein product [Soboliphyme baturini]